MNKAIILQSEKISGAEKRFFRLAKELNLINEYIYLIIDEQLLKIALDDSELAEIVHYLKKNNYLKILSNNGKRSKLSQFVIELLSLWKIIKKENIKLLHLVLRSRRLSIIKQLTGVKCISEITSPDVADSLKEFHHRLMLRFNDRFIAVSPTVEEKMINSFELINKDDFIKRIENIPIPFFLPDKNVTSVLNEKQNIIVYASRFIERKNPILFAEAVKIFLREYGDWKVVMLGSGELENEIKEILVKEISENKVIVEYSKDIYKYLKKSKIFVSLIYPDNYPSQSILEAMYMKNAIVATNVGSTKRFFEDNGLLVEEFNAQEVYYRLSELITNYNLETMGEQSYSLLMNKFSTKIYLNKLSEIYSSLI